MSTALEEESPYPSDEKANTSSRDNDEEYRTVGSSRRGFGGFLYICVHGQGPASEPSLELVDTFDEYLGVGVRPARRLLRCRSRKANRQLLIVHPLRYLQPLVEVTLARL